MRRMSFALTERQLLDGSKTVTRRLGWSNLRPGDELVAVRKAMGLRKGERQHVLGTIRVVSVRREPVAYASILGEATREGFPELEGYPFVEFFCAAQRCTPAHEVTRIEFSLRDKEDSAPKLRALIEQARVLLERWNKLSGPTCEQLQADTWAFLARLEGGTDA